METRQVEGDVPGFAGVRFELRRLRCRFLYDRSFRYDRGFRFAFRRRFGRRLCFEPGLRF
jgi:hypothetical protein